MKITVSLFFINRVGAEETGGLYFIGVDDHAGVLSNLILQQLNWHLEKLIEVHCISIPHVALNFLFGLGVLGGDAKFVKFNFSILGFTVVEGFFDLDDLILIETPVHVLLHLEVL